MGSASGCVHQLSTPFEDSGEEWALRYVFHAVERDSGEGPRDLSAAAGAPKAAAGALHAVDRPESAGVAAAPAERSGSDGSRCHTRSSHKHGAMTIKVGGNWEAMFLVLARLRSRFVLSRRSCAPSASSPTLWPPWAEVGYRLYDRSDSPRPTAGWFPSRFEHCSTKSGHVSTNFGSPKYDVGARPVKFGPFQPNFMRVRTMLSYPRPDLGRFDPLGDLVHHNLVASCQSGSNTVQFGPHPGHFRSMFLPNRVGFGSSFVNMSPNTGSTSAPFQL